MIYIEDGDTLFAIPNAKINHIRLHKTGSGKYLLGIDFQPDNYWTHDFNTKSQALEVRYDICAALDKNKSVSVKV